MIQAIDCKKSDKIWKISNPIKVQENANKYYNNMVVYRSDKPNKKYFIIHNNSKIYFGSSSYPDYTYHLDEKRLINFRKRNYKWKLMHKYSPGHLAYYLLW